MPGKPSRGLPYDDEFKGPRDDELKLFVRKIPKSMSLQELEAFFGKYGPVKFVSIKLNSDHTSKG